MVRKPTHSDPEQGPDHETLLDNRETWIRAREYAAEARESAADSREFELTSRERLAQLRDEALRARAEIDAIRADRERLLVQMREANERLVLAALRADELVEESVGARRSLAESVGAARESEARYRTLFDSIDEGFCVIEVLYDHGGSASDFRYLEANPAFEKQTGLHDAVGKRITELVPDLEPHWAQTYGHVVASGRAVRFVLEARPLGRWFDVYAFRLGESERRRVACLFTDVTASRHAQQAVEHLAAVVTSSSDAIITTDLRGSIESWNEGARRLFGYAAEEVIGRPDALLVPADRLDEAARVLDRVGRGELVDHYETVRCHKDGDLLDVWLAVSPLRDADGRVVRAASVARDITEFKRVNAQLRAASRAKDEFLAMLGHELRNPLAPILTALNLVALRDPSAFERERIVIERQVTHLVHLVDDLLDVSRITSGKIELQRRPIELASVVSHAVEMTSPLLENKFHNLSVQVAPRGLTIDGDTTRLAQVVSNLLANAAKYTPAGGTITITGERRGSVVSLRVRDNGIGISEEMLPRIFELFTQERQALDRAQGGLGLGLAIVNSLVAMHDGTVTARSDGIGRGSEFEIELPASTAGVAADPRPERDAPGAAAAGDGAVARAARARVARKILVVDDNRDAAELVAESLAALGHDVRTAFDAPTALATVDGFVPDVALLDIGLPVMDGYELASRLRELLAPREPRLIAITGYSEVIERSRSRRAGFALHLVKPVAMAVLQDSIRLVMEGPPPPADVVAHGSHR